MNWGKETNQYTPIHDYKAKFKFYDWLWVSSMNDNIIPDDKFNKYSFDANTNLVLDNNGIRSDENLGYVDVDEVKLTACWKTLIDIQNKLTEVWKAFDIEIMDNISTRLWIDTFTNLVKIVDGKYILSEVDTTIEPMMYDLDNLQPNQELVWDILTTYLII